MTVKIVQEKDLFIYLFYNYILSSILNEFLNTVKHFTKAYLIHRIDLSFFLSKLS